ncbi:MAG: PTS sugar transporter subunit IIA [Candidatus Omnitrophota bacterium]
MIDLNCYLNNKAIISKLRANTKEEALRELVDKFFENIAESKQRVTSEEVFAQVMKRENLQTTGIGNNLAVPHARIEGWEGLTIVMGVSEKGIDFKSIDNNPVRFIFLMISSPDEPYIILQAMSSIVRLMTDLGIETGVLNDSANVQQVLNNFLKKEIQADEYILASDIARPVMDYVTMDSSIEEVSRIMHLKKLDILPVVDEKRRFCGEISCCDIFEFGMPDFFKQLNTISFVKHIDPFEKYFRIKKDLKVKDVFTRDSDGMKSDRTLLEIIFEMTVRQRSKIFVVKDDGTLIGIIDRFCIIDKILFF